LPFSYVPVGDDRSEQEQRFAAAIEALEPDLVVLARYMRILPAWLTKRYEHAMINVHHSFLPAFVGANPYRRAFERGVKMVGATAHYVTAELDAGPIIAQDVTSVSHADTVEDVVRRGADIERAVFIRAIRLHTEHRIQVFGNKTCIFD
jgi:formyltetrahydrofolate deformylase